MAVTTYTYNIANDFPDGKCNRSTLDIELRGSSIVTSLNRIDISNGTQDSANVYTAGTLDIVYNAALSAGDKTILDGDTTGPAGGLLAAHDNAPTTDAPKLNDSNIMLMQLQPQKYTYEMCDRDIRINPCLLDDAAALTINGVDANGHITYTAQKLGAYGNDITVEHITGATGGGNENRALAASSSSQAITVTFGTDGSGNSVTPTANAIKTAVDADTGCANLVSVAVGGTGASNNATAASANLTGGVDNSFEDMKICPTSNKECIWGEMEQVGVYKDDSGTMVLCTTQADADTNGILSVWKYKGIDQSDMVTEVSWDIKDGCLWVDSTLPANEIYDHRVYAMAGHSLGQANHVRLFDGYLGPMKGDVIQALSPQAKTMNPALAPTASEVKVWIKHPAGSKLSHVLRFVTYRAKGTY